MGVTFAGINIYAKDPAATFEFYRGIGLAVYSEAKADDEWYGAAFALADTKRPNGEPPLLWVWRDHGEEPLPSNLIVLGCDDIEGTYAALRDKGYAVNEPETMFYGGKEMKLTDPDGNRVLFLG